MDDPLELLKKVRSKQPNPNSPGSLSQVELEDTLRKAGWDEQLIPKMAAIGMAESALTPDGRAKIDSYNPGRGAGGKKTVEESVGVWQINMHPSLGRTYDRQRLATDPVYNAQVAKELYDERQKKGKNGLTHWGAYTDGRYKKFYTGTPLSTSKEVSPLDLLDKVRKTELTTEAPQVPYEPDKLWPVGGLKPGGPSVNVGQDPQSQPASSNGQLTPPRVSREYPIPSLTYQEPSPEQAKLRKSYNKYIQDLKLEDNDESVKQFNSHLQDLHKSNKLPGRNATLYTPAQLQLQQQVAKQLRPEAPVDSETQEGVVPDNFSRVVDFSHLPKGVSKTEYLIQNLIPEIASKTGLNAADIEDELRRGIKHLEGPTIEKSNAYQFDVTPEFIDAVSLQGAKKRETLKGLVASGMEFDPIAVAEKYKLDPRELENALTGQDPQYSEEYKQHIANKEKFENLKKTYQNSLKPNEPISIARIKAERDMGWPTGDIEKELQLAQRLIGNEPGSVKPSKINTAEKVNAGWTSKDEDRVNWEAVNRIAEQYGSLAAYEKEQNKLKEKYKYRPLAAPLEFAKRFGNAAPQAVASILKTMAIVQELYTTGPAQGIDGLFGTELSKTFSAPNNPIYKLGKEFGDYFNSLKNKDFDNIALISVVPDSLGQITVQMLAGLATGGATLPTAIGATMGSSAQYEEAAKFTNNPNTRLFASAIGAAAAIPDAIAYNRWLKGLNGTEKIGFVDKLMNSIYARLGVRFGEDAAETLTKPIVKAWLENAIKGGLFEGVQEVSENKINDFVARWTYDPSKERVKKLWSITEEDKLSFLGGLVGGIGGGSVQTKLESKSLSELKAAYESLPDLLNTQKFQKRFDEAQANEIVAKFNEEFKRRKVDITPITLNKRQIKKSVKDQLKLSPEYLGQLELNRKAEDKKASEPVVEEYQEGETPQFELVGDDPIQLLDSLRSQAESFNLSRQPKSKNVPPQNQDRGTIEANEPAKKEIKPKSPRVNKDVTPKDAPAAPIAKVQQTEQLTEPKKKVTPPVAPKVELKPENIHSQAKALNIDVDSPLFHKISKELIGIDKLDEMTPKQLEKVSKAITNGRFEKATVTEKKTQELQKQQEVLTAQNTTAYVMGIDPRNTKYVFLEDEDGNPSRHLVSTVKTKSDPTFFKSAIDNFLTTHRKNKNFSEFIKDTKVVDYRGLPQIMFHGAVDFKGNIFDPQESVDFGHHFGDVEQANDRVSRNNVQYDPETRTLETNKAFARSELIPVVLKIKNPIRMRDEGEWSGRAVLSQAKAQGIIDKDEMAQALEGPHKHVEEKTKLLLEKKGYDGIVYKNEYEGEVHKDSYIAFRPNQIKSIFNEGTFDEGQSSILKAAADKAKALGATGTAAQWINRNEKEIKDWNKYLKAKQNENGPKVIGIGLEPDPTPGILVLKADVEKIFQEKSNKASIDKVTTVDLDAYLKQMADNNVNVENEEIQQAIWAYRNSPEAANKQLSEFIRKNRDETLEDWYNYIHKENHFYAKDPFFKDWVWTDLIKLRDNRPDLPLGLDKAALAAVYQDVKDKPNSSPFQKLYEKKVTELMLKDAETSEILKVPDGTWIKIPRTEKPTRTASTYPAYKGKKIDISDTASLNIAAYTENGPERYVAHWLKSFSEDPSDPKISPAEAKQLAIDFLRNNIDRYGEDTVPFMKKIEALDPNDFSYESSDPGLVKKWQEWHENVTKVQAVSRKEWCTSQGMAEAYLPMGDFWVLIKNNKSELAVRFNGNAVAEIQGKENNGTIPEEFLPDVKTLVRSGKVELTISSMDQILRALRESKFKAKVKSYNEEFLELAHKHGGVGVSYGGRETEPWTGIIVQSESGTEREYGIPLVQSELTYQQIEKSVARIKESLTTRPNDNPIKREMGELFLKHFDPEYTRLQSQAENKEKKKIETPKSLDFYKEEFTRIINKELSNIKDEKIKKEIGYWKDLSLDDFVGEDAEDGFSGPPTPENISKYIGNFNFSKETKLIAAAIFQKAVVPAYQEYFQGKKEELDTELSREEGNKRNRYEEAKELGPEYVEALEYVDDDLINILDKSNGMGEFTWPWDMSASEIEKFEKDSPYTLKYLINGLDEDRGPFMEENFNSEEKRKKLKELIYSHYLEFGEQIKEKQEELNKELGSDNPYHWILENVSKETLRRYQKLVSSSAWNNNLTQKDIDDQNEKFDEEVAKEIWNGEQDELKEQTGDNFSELSKRIQATLDKELGPDIPEDWKWAIDETLKDAANETYTKLEIAHIVSETWATEGRITEEEKNSPKLDAAFEYYQSEIAKLRETKKKELDKELEDPRDKIYNKLVEDITTHYSEYFEESPGDAIDNAIQDWSYGAPEFYKLYQELSDDEARQLSDSIEDNAEEILEEAKKSKKAELNKELEDKTPLEKAYDWIVENALFNNDSEVLKFYEDVLNAEANGTYEYEQFDIKEYVKGLIREETGEHVRPYYERKLFDNEDISEFYKKYPFAQLWRNLGQGGQTQLVNKLIKDLPDLTKQWKEKKKAELDSEIQKSVDFEKQLQQYERAKLNREYFATNFTAKVDKDGNIEISPKVAVLISRAEGKDKKLAPVLFTGGMLRLPQVKFYTAQLGNLIANAPKEWSKKDLAPLVKVYQTLKSQIPNKSALLYVDKSKIPHEMQHKLRYEHSGHQERVRDYYEDFDALYKELENIQIEAFEEYFSRVYFNNKEYNKLRGSDKEILHEETFVHLVDNKYHELGLTIDQSAKFIDTAIKAYVKKNGTGILREQGKWTKDAKNKEIIENNQGPKAPKGKSSRRRKSSQESPAGDGSRGEEAPPPETPADVGPSLTERAYPNNIARHTQLNPEDLHFDSRYYDPQARSPVEREAYNWLQDRGISNAYFEAFNQPVNALGVAKRQAVMSYLDAQISEFTRQNNLPRAQAVYDQFVSLVNIISPEATDWGQAISQMAQWSYLNPDAVIYTLENQRERAGKKRGKLDLETQEKVRQAAKDLKALDKDILTIQDILRDSNSQATRKSLENVLKLKPNAIRTLRKYFGTSNPSQILKATPDGPQLSRGPDQSNHRSLDLLPDDFPMEALMNLGKIKYLEGKSTEGGMTLTDFKSSVINEMEENHIDPTGAEPYMNSLYLKVRELVRSEQADVEIARAKKRYKTEDTSVAMEKLAQEKAIRAAKASLAAHNVREAKKPKDKRTALDIAIDNEFSELSDESLENAREDVHIIKDKAAYYKKYSKQGMKPSEITPQYLKMVERYLDIADSLKQARLTIKAQKDLAPSGGYRYLSPSEQKNYENQLFEKRREKGKKLADFNGTVRHLTERPEGAKGKIADWYLRMNRAGETGLTGALATLSHNVIAQRGTKLLNALEIAGEVAIGKFERAIGRDIFSKGKFDTNDATRLRDLIFEELKSSSFPQIRQAVMDQYRGDSKLLASLGTAFAHKDRVVQGILAHNPDLYERMIGKFSYGDEDLKRKPVDSSYNKVEKGVEYGVRAVEHWIHWVTTFNALQEKHFRFATFLGVLSADLKARGIDPEMVFNGNIDMLDRFQLERAVKRALEDTFGEDIPKDTDFGRFLSATSNAAKWIPFPLNPVLFRRFLFNSSKFLYEHTPLALAKMATDKGLNKRDFMKVVSGMGLFTIALQLLSQFGSDDDDPLTLTFPGWMVPDFVAEGDKVTLKMAAYNPLSSFLILANVVNRARKGKKPLKNLNEIWKLFGVDTRYPNLAMEWYKSLISVVGSEEQAKYTKFSNMSKTVAGRGLSAYLKAFNTLKDIQSTFDTEEATIRDYYDEPFIGELKKVMPMSEKMTKFLTGENSLKKEVATTGDIDTKEHPALNQLGFTLVPERQVGAKFTPAEDYLDNELRISREKNTKFYKSPEDRRRSAVTAQLYNALDKGISLEKFNERVDYYANSGVISRETALKLIDASKYSSPIARQASQATIPMLVESLAYAFPGEEEIIKEFLIKKARSQYKNKSLSTEEIQALIRVFPELTGEVH